MGVQVEQVSEHVYVLIFIDTLGRAWHTEVQ